MDTALAEVRPPVGSDVAVAKFNIVRPLRLLDLTLLSDVHVTGSIFDTSYADRLGHKTFLRKLVDRMTRAVMPDDQDSEYLPTQAIADYLATSETLNIDGIVFPSVQTSTKGLNVVLFHKASRCKTLSFPVGTELSADTYQMYAEGPEPEYQVIEEVPPEKKKDEEPKQKFPFPPSLPYLDDAFDTDGRDKTLEIDLCSVRVHVVHAVTIKADDFEVERVRWTKNGDVF